MKNVESKARTYQGRVGAGRRTAGRRGGGRAGQDGTPMGRSAQETDIPCAFRGFQGIVRNCPERPPGSKNKRNPSNTELGNTITGWPAVDPRDEGCSSFLVADQWAVAYLSL